MYNNNKLTIMHKFYMSHFAVSYRNAIWYGGTMRNNHLLYGVTKYEINSRGEENKFLFTQYISLRKNIYIIYGDRFLVIHKINKA